MTRIISSHWTEGDGGIIEKKGSGINEKREWDQRKEGVGSLKRGSGINVKRDWDQRKEGVGSLKKREWYQRKEEVGSTKRGSGVNFSNTPFL